MQLKIGLNTDFRDWYDHVFYHWSNADKVIRRKASAKIITKAEQFLWMNRAGLSTPKCGVLPYLDRPESGKVVVYTFPYMHRGEGKELVDYDVALQKWNGVFASHYIDWIPSESFRVLRLGVRWFLMRYESKDDWRSNCGDVEVTDIEELNGRSSDEFIRADDMDRSNLGPLWAVDYVNSQECYQAIDFNLAPGTRHTGLEEVLSASDVYESFSSFYITRASNGLV